MPDPFISVADLTDSLGRDMSSDPGATIAVDAACDTVRTLADHVFNEGTTTMRLDGTGTDALVLPERPVSSVSDVQVSGGGTMSWTLSDQEEGVLIAGDSSGTTLGATWPAGRQNVTVTYVHGYGTADVPRDVRAVALSVAQRLVIQGPPIQETVGDVSLRYSTSQLDLTAGEMAILAKYRR